MKEIKFRAWDSSTEEMVDFGDLLCKQGHFDALVNTLATGTAAYNSESQTYILMQYTGLKDRHGVEIYEGDIIRIKNNHGYFIKKSVAWNNGNRWQGFRVGKGDREIEVIGNVYENPELLEAEL